MGKQGSPRSPQPKNPMLDVSYGLKECDFRCSEKKQQHGDPCLGRRGSGGDNHWNKVILMQGLRNHSGKFTASKGVVQMEKRPIWWWLRRHIKSIIFTILLTGFLFAWDSILFVILDNLMLQNSSTPSRTIGTEV